MPTSATCRATVSAGARPPRPPPTSRASRSGPCPGRGPEPRPGSCRGRCRFRLPRAVRLGRFLRLRPATPGSESGFTLLELVVVLLLLSLVAALAFPNLERLYAGVVRSTERAYILDQFTGLGRRAMQGGRTFVVVASGGGKRSATAAAPREARARPGDTGPLPPAARRDDAPHRIDLPEGWEISFDEPLVVRANGVCLGAELTLRHRGEVDVRIRLEPPFCRVDADA